MARLRGYIDDTVTEIQVDDTTDLPTNGGVLDVESEKISYTYATDKAVFGCTRGYDGSTAVAHDDGTLVTPEDTVEPLYSLQEYNGHGAPIDNQTGVKYALKGTRYTDLDTAAMYVNVSDENTPTWQPFAEGTAGGASGPAGSVQLSDGASNFVSDPDILFTAGALEVVHITNKADGSNLEIDETQGANIQIHNEPGMGGTVQITSDADLTLLSNSGVLRATATNGNVEIESTGGDTVFTNPSGNIRTAGTIGGDVSLDAGGVIDLKVQGESLFKATGNGTTVFPGRASDGFNEIQIRGDSGCYVDFYHNDLIEISSRIISNIDFDLRLVTRDTMPVRVIVDEQSANKQWSFEVDGTLTLPADGILSQPSGRFLIIPGSDTGTMEVQGRNDGYGEIALKADGGYLGFKGNDGHYIGRFNWTDNSYLRLDTKQAIPLVLHIDADGADKTWTFATDGSLTLPGDLDASSGDLSVNNIDLAQRMNVQIPGNFIAQSSTFTNLYLEGSTGIELIPTTGGLFISHSTGGADACAAMHFETSGQGVILPRMDTTTRDAIASPSIGLIIYNTTTNVLNFYNGSVWGAV